MKLLDGIRVIESAAVITGPLAAMMLADLGAEVIKVEPPGGEQFRRWEPDKDELSPTFSTYNRGKRSIVLDLKTEAGQDIYRDLVASADVVIENFRPGVMKKLGLDHDSLRDVNPTIVYCHVTGMGTVGPNKDHPTFDAVAQALSGLWSQLTDMADPEPVGPPISDQLTGIFTALGVLGGLQRRALSGEGTKIEINMLASSLAFLGPSIASYLHDGEISHKTSRARLSQSYAFVAGDGKPFAVHLSTPTKFWKALCEVAGNPELADDPAYNTKSKRVARYHELSELFNEIFAKEPRDEWLKRLNEADVPCAPILGIDEAVVHPQVEALGIIQKTGVRGVPGLVKSPLSVDGEHLAATRSAPQLGDQTVEILTELGVPDERIEALRGDGVVWQAP